MFEFVKVNKKIIYIIIITIVLFIGVSKSINSCSHSVVDNLLNEVETESIKKLSMYIQKDAGEVLKGIAMKNGDWSTYPLSKEFLEKYNSNDGIFPKYKFTEISYNTMKSEAYQENNRKGSFWYNLSVPINRSIDRIGPAWSIKIEYYLNNKGEIIDFKVVDEKQTYDSEGYPIKAWDKEITAENFCHIINNILFYNKHRMYLMADNPYIKKQPVTNRLLEKVIVKNESINDYFCPEFVDFFSKTKYEIGSLCIPHNGTIEEAFETKEIFACCKHYNDGFDFPIEDFVPSNNYLYRVCFNLNKDNKLDDIWVEFIGEVSYEVLHEKYDETIYKY